MFDIYTIIFLALAVFIFLRLRSVLGQRSGAERPPFDIKSARDVSPQSGSDNVVPLPRASADANAGATEAGFVASAEPWQGIAEPGSAVALGIAAIAERDRSFDGKAFIAGARGAYEMIVTAFAAGDRDALKDLLSAEVYDGFDAAIKDREQRGETQETRFVGIDKADVVSAGLDGPTAHITISFVSQMISATRDSSGTVIDGSAEKVTDVTDVWTFARDVTSRDPNWKLVGTAAGE